MFVEQMCCDCVFVVHYTCLYDCMFVECGVDLFI